MLESVLSLLGNLSYFFILFWFDLPHLFLLLMIFFFYCELLDAGKYPENFHFLLGDNSSGWISTTSSIKKERERERWFSTGDITINLSNNLSVYCSYESLIELILVVESNLYNTSCVKAFHFFGCVPCFCSLGQTLGFVSFQKIEI